MTRLDLLVATLVAALFAWRFLSATLARRKLPAVLQARAQVVDVRSPAEFDGGHAEGSMNIPLQDLGARTNELDARRWVVVCCASGSRSAMARALLRRRGFKQVLNAGSWRNLPCR